MEEQIKDIKKESPNEGTETKEFADVLLTFSRSHKKRIPEWGDGNLLLQLV